MNKLKLKMDYDGFRVFKLETKNGIGSLIKIAERKCFGALSSELLFV